MPRSGLTTDTVIERGAELVERNGLDDLTLAALADSLGVRPPSLYKHVNGLPGLRRGILVRAKRALAHELAQATIGRSRGDAVTSLATAYRRWALANPAQYPLTLSAPDPDDADDVSASAASLDVIFAVLDAYGLHEDDAVDATRFLRSAIHGFVSLETGGGFQLAVHRDRSYDRLVHSVVVALEGWHTA